MMVVVSELKYMIKKNYRNVEISSTFAMYKLYIHYIKN